MMPPTLETPRLLLEPLSVVHAHDYQRHFSNFEVAAFLSRHVPWPYPEGGARSFIEMNVQPEQGRSRWNWAILKKGDEPEFIGAIELLREAEPTNRGFWLARPYWGHGYMTEAADHVTAFAFEELGFEKLMFGNAVENTRSRRIKEQTRARLVRHVPCEFVDRSLTTLELWELTKVEWEAERGR